MTEGDVIKFIPVGGAPYVRLHRRDGGVIDAPAPVVHDALIEVMNALGSLWAEGYRLEIKYP